MFLHLILDSLDLFWLGASDSDVEGVWRCIQTGHEIANENDPGPMFYAGQPDGGGRENCAVIAKGRDYLLSDVSCSNTYPYMCEKDQP